MMLPAPALRRAARSRRVLWAAALFALATLLSLRVPREARTAADFPHHSPSVVAHFLADFSNHPQLYTHISGPWTVEEESSNYTWWRYVVAYSCGARCAGRAELLAGGDGAPGRRSELHRVELRDARCLRLPALPWPRLCEYMETDTVVRARAGGGARLEEAALAVRRAGGGRGPLRRARRMTVAPAGAAERAALCGALTEVLPVVIE